jgi:RNA polymerase sigma-70 factor (ECF subfamily)
MLSLNAEVEYLFRVACRLTGDPHDAEDLVQDVCERALRKAPPFATAADCRRWLLRVLFNLFVDGTRHRVHAPVGSHFGADGSAAIAVAADPEELASRSESELMLTRAWARLEPMQQALLLLRAEGHNLDEMARITDLDKPVISSRLYRARSSLATYLKLEKAR